MAMEEIFRGLVNIDVNDNNAISEVAQIVERVKAEFAKLADIPTASIGPSLTGPLGTTLGDIEHQIGKMRELAAEYKQLADAQAKGGGMSKAQKDELRAVEELIRANNQLEQKYREVAAARDRSAYNQTLLGGGGRDAAENRMRELVAQGGDEASLRREMGLPTIEEGSTSKYKPRSAEELDRLQRVAVPDATAMEFDVLKQRVAKASEAYDQATLGLQKSYKTQAQAQAADERYLAASQQLTAASQALAKAEQKASAALIEQQAVSGRAQANAQDPRLSALSMSNEEFIKAQGLDPKDSARTKIKAELAAIEAKTAELAATNVAAMTQEQQAQLNVTKLTEQKAALALKEMQLKSQLVALEEKERLAARGDGGFAGGLLGRNKSDDGFGQGMGYQAGVTLKYFALYSAFAAIQGALAQMKQDTEEYTAAITDLSIATNTSYESAQKLADEYQAIGAQFGQGPISTAQAMAQYARTYGGSADSLQIGARVGGIVNTLEPEARRDNAMQDLIAVAKAYNIGPGASEELLNQILSVARHYGFQTAGQVLPGVSAVGDIGKESGYTPAQLAALIANVMREQGVGADAAAGDIKRFLGSGNDPNFIRLFDTLGINQDDTMKAKFDQLSQKLSTMSEDQQARTLVTLGNPRIAATVVAAVRGIPEANQAASSAETGSTGLAASVAEKNLANLRGQLQQFGQEVQTLFLEMADTGVFNVLVLLLQTGKAFVDLLGRMLSVFNSMPSVIKEITGALLILYAANRGVSALTAGGSLAGMGPLGRIAPTGTSIFAAGGASAQQAQVQRSLALAMGETTAGATVAATASTTLGARLTGMAATLRGAAVGVAGLLAALLPMIALAAGVTVISDANASKDQQTGAANNLLGGYQDLQKAKASGNAEQIKAAQERIKGAIPELQKGNDGFTGWLMNQLTPGLEEARQGLIDKANGLVTDAQNSIDAVLKLEAELDSKSPTSQYFGKNYNNVTRGVQLIKSKGLGADTVTRIIDDLLRQAPEVTQAALQPAEGQQGLPDLVTLQTQRIGATPDSEVQSSQLGALAKVLQDARVRLAARLTAQQKDLEGARQAGFDTSGLQGAVATSESLLSALDGQLDQVNKAFTTAVVGMTRKRVDLLKKNYTGSGTEAQIRAELTKAMTAAAQSGDVDALTELMNGADKAFNAEFVRQLKARQAALKMLRDGLQLAITAALSALQSIPHGVPDSVTDPRRDALTALQDRLGPMDAQQKAIDAQVKAAEAALQRALPSGADTKAPANELAISKALEAAQVGNPVEQAKAQLTAARLKLSQTTKDTAAYYDALKGVNDAERALAQAKLEKTQAEAAAAVPAGNSLEAAKAAVAAARRQVAFAVVGTAEYWNGIKALHQAQYDLARLQLNISLAQKQAGEIPGDPMSAARIALDAARRQLAFTKDPLEYWNALRTLRQAQYDLAKLELQMASAQDTLRIDITDPVAQANAKVRDAQRQLAFDRNRGAGSDVLLQDQVALRQAQSDAQGTAWQQEFSDQRTNYELQRTSLSAYLSYLRAQHDYLSAVKNKTRQQVDELNQVDQALKGLTEGLQGQWNLGDIKVPTAYEMRRSLAGGGFTTAAVSYVNISLTAASDADLKRVLETYVGTPIMQTVATAPAKV